MKGIALVLVVLASVVFCPWGMAEPEHGSHGMEPVEHIHGSHPECPPPEQSQDVMVCAINGHPSVTRARLVSEQNEKLPDVARQLPNPDLDVESAFGQDNRMDTEVALLQPIELGGKRAARVRVAKVRQSLTAAELTRLKAEIAIETVVRLHRLRQLKVEKTLVNETIYTLQKLIAQQKSLPTLTPEQRVSLSVSGMARAQAQLRLSELYEEERAQEHYFHVSTGHSLTELLKVLPPSPRTWPSVEGIGSGGAPSPELQLAMIESQAARAELQAEEAASWPDLRLGPKVALDREGSNTSELFGIKLMLELPVLNANAAGRAHAAAGVVRTEKLIELVKSEEKHERAEQVRVYQNAVAALKQAPEIGLIEREHRKNENLARRGLISGPLLIESHRQRMELVQNWYARELQALRALWSIYKFDGRIFEEKL